MPKRLFLIDGTALAYRSYFAFANSPRTSLTTSTGHPTGATFGFVQTLRALLEKERPDAIAIAFDGPRADLHRTAIYPDYKSTRQKMPDEMALQLDDIRAVVDAFGLAVVEREGEEADDVIGTLALAGRAAGLQVLIVTGDKDFLQLVDDERILLWNLRSSTSKPEILGAAQAQAKWGVAPAQMIDLLALMGDSSDNVPGVPRVGEKTAVELLRQFGSLDALLARTAEVKKPAIRAALEQHKDSALLSRELVTLRTDLPLPLDVAAIGPARPDPARLRALFERLQFDSLLSKLEIAPPPDAVAKDWGVVRDAAGFEHLLAALGAAPAFALALETTSRHLREARIVGIAFAWRPGVARYLPLDLEPPVLAGGRAALLAALQPLLADAGRRKTSADVKFDLGALRTAGIDGRGFDFDPTLAAYCIEPGGGQDLDALLLRHFGQKKIASKDLLGSGKQQKTFDQIDVSLVGDHACQDADYVQRLRPLLQQQLDAQRVAPLFAELEMPLVPVLLDMEWEGIAIDSAHLAAFGRELDRRIAELEQRVHQRAGAPFNLGSPQQVGKVLFDDLEVHRLAELPRPKRTATGQYKTDHDVLEKLAPHHEVPALLLEWRMLTKLKGTYVDSLPGMVSKVTGRIHTTFNQTVAATGRLSSDNPNLQNIPIRTEAGKKVRAAFVARASDWVLLSADYSQIELRILAHLSGDKALVESFRKGEDIHARTAALVHGLLPHMVTPELRNQAKVINYGLMYGMGSSRLANETGMSPPEARRFIDSYFRALPGVKHYLDQSLQQARTQKEVRTLFGRRRALADIDSTNAGLRVAAENMAVNTPLQGTAADIVKRAMLAVHAGLQRRRLQSRLILQVHDELVLDVPQTELAEVQLLVREAMMSAADLKVPLEVSMGSGANWLAAH